MRPTLIDIAREAGVSSATVDRVLNGRAGVRERTRGAVFEAARKLGYISEAGPAAANPVELEFILPMGSNVFVKSLHQHIVHQASQRPGLSVAVSTIPGFDANALAAALRKSSQNRQGVGLIAIDHPVVREAIRLAAEAGVKIVTLASDISNVPRQAYVGIDNRQAGRLAGFVLGRMLGERPTAKIALFAGSLSYRGHEEREMGFRHILRNDFPHFDIVALSEVQDDHDTAFREASALLDRHDDLAAIYNIGAGNLGIAAALKARNLERSVLFIGHEATQDNRELLLDGTIDAVIDQNPRVEAREALNILTNAVRGEPYEPHQPRLQIIFRENIPDV